MIGTVSVNLRPVRFRKVRLGPEEVWMIGILRAVVIDHQHGAVVYWYASRWPLSPFARSATREEVDAYYRSGIRSGLLSQLGDTLEELLK